MFGRMLRLSTALKPAVGQYFSLMLTSRLH